MLSKSQAVLFCLLVLFSSYCFSAVTISSNPSTTGNYTVSWNSGAGRVSVHEQVGGQDPVLVYDGSDAQLNLTGKANGTYTYSVLDHDGGGCHSYIGCIPASLGSSTVTVSLLSPPGRPSTITAPAVSANGEYTVSWSTSSGQVDRYQLQERANGGSWSTIQNNTSQADSFSKSPDNYFDYRVRACNQAGCSSYTSYTRVLIPESSGAPMPAAFSQPVHNPAVGALSGEHSVEQDGSAGYTVPIQAGGGRAGVQPSLSIKYSSNGGSSALGQGWTLDGLSAIQRCPNNRLRGEEADPVDYSPNDKFCLDGQRLVLINGSFYGANGAEYRKENDDGTKVVSYGQTGSFSPTYFRIWEASGLIKQYGANSNSRILANGLNEVATWALNRVEDRYSNYMTFSYYKPSGSGNYRPSRIDYTGNSNASVSPSRSVRFVYSENRPDPSKSFLGGVSSQLTWLMTAIELYSENTLLKEYNLEYDNLNYAPQTSMLSSIELCADNVCMIPTEINWSDEQFGYSTISSWQSATAGGVNAWSRDGKREQYVDLNGDGLQDRIWDPKGNVNGYYVAINTGSGFGSPTRWIAPTVNVNGLNVISRSAGREWYIDIDGDGLQDRVWDPDGSNNRIYWLKNTGSSFVNPQVLIESGYNFTTSVYEAYIGMWFDQTITISSSPHDGRESFVDINNDGLVDFVWTPNDRYETYVMLNQGGGDFSQLEEWMPNNVRLSTENRTVQSFSSAGKYEYYVDMNGDGVADKLWMPYGNNNTSDWYVALGTGDGFGFISQWLDNTESPVRHYATDGNRQRIIDLTGDGLPDLVWAPHDAPSGYVADYFVAVNNGAGFETPTRWLDNGDGGVNSTSTDGKREQYVDLNGDGLPDRLWIPHERQDYYVAFNTGFGFDTPVRWQSNNAGGVTTYSNDGRHESVVDVNGDGFPDRVWNPYSPNNNFYVALTRPNHRQVESIVAGNAGSETGHTTSFYYKPSSDSNVYTRSNDLSGTFPTNPDTSTKSLVHRVTTTNGVGGVLTTEYHYNKAKIDLSGHGSLGFESMTTRNVDNGISTTTYFNQDVSQKTQGSVNRVLTRFGNITLSDTTNEWVNVSIGSGDSARSRMDLLSTNIVKRDLNGAFLSDERNVYQYNSYGSPTTTTTTLHDQYGQQLRHKVTTSTFHNFNASTYLQPVPRKTRVEVTVTGKPTLTSVTGWTYHATTGKKLKDQVLHPATESVLSETEYHDIDSFGNHLQTTVRGSDFTTRTNSVTYDATGTHVVSATNPLGHTESKSYYSNSSINAGRVNVATDINGMRTKYYYDAFGRVTRKISAYGTSYPVNTRTSFQWCADITDSKVCTHEMSDSVQIYRITTSTDGGSGTHVYVDKLGREVKSSSQGLDGRFINVVNHYNDLGWNYKVCDPFYDGTPPNEIIVTEVEHDALGRVIRSEEANGVVNEVIYNGLEKTSINNVGSVNEQRKIERRDLMNNVVEVEDNARNLTTYNHDSLGNLLSVTNSMGHSTTIEYDALGRKIEMDDLDKGLWRYTYNGLGQLVTQTNARGETSCMRYDLLGRMTRRYDNYFGSVNRSLGGSANAKNNCASAGTSTYNYWTYDIASGKSLGKLYRSGSSDGNYRLTNYFDSTYGRQTRVDERIDGRTYRTDTTYDQYHRASIVTYPGVYDRLRVESVYNDLGFQVQLRDADNTSTVFYTIVETDAQGNAREEIYGNGVSTTRQFDPITNRVTHINSWAPLDSIAPSIQELDFTFDVAGNLTERNDFIQNIGETFEYDDLNRLIDTYADFGNGNVRNTRVAYNAIGNITFKTGVGNYSYGGTCNGRQAGPHAVTSITSPKSTNYCYDANGNMISGDGRTISYTSFDKPDFIQQGSNTTSITYSPDRNRYKRVDEVANKTTTYNYVGGLYEHVTHDNGDVEQRSFIGGDAIFTYTRKANGSTSDTTHYLHKDHLGSITVITDNGLNVVEEFSFDPWGKRRAPNLSTLTGTLGSWSSLTSHEKANLTIESFTLSSSITNKGFTGHEQLDGVGLIHMNGRVYDAEIGRFISADPHVQDMTNSQALNRYSYVQNNPLSYTDPSGYFLKNIFKKFKKHLKKRVEHLKKRLKQIGNALNAVPGLSTVVGLVISFYCPPCGAAYFQYLTLLNMAISLANGVPPGAVLTNAAVGYVTGGVGAGIGNIVGNQVVGSMIASGIAAKASGGKFIDGVKSAAVSAATNMAANAVGDKLVEGLAAMGESKVDSAPAQTTNDGGGTCSGKPINLATGEKYLKMLDYKASGASRIKFERYYSSYKLDGGSLGKGWKSNFDKKLDLTSYQITAERVTGDNIVFEKVLEGGLASWKPKGNDFEKLSQTSNGWELTLTDNTTETYDNDGRLISIQALDGYEQTLTYENQDDGKLVAITDSFGHSLRFEHDYYGRIRRVLDQSDLVVQFNYDTHGNLVRVIEADSTPASLIDNPYKRYHYEDHRYAHAITRVSNSVGESIHHIAYDAQGRATLSALGNYIEADRVEYSEVTLASGEFRKVNTFTNSLGKRTTYSFNSQNKPVEVLGHATQNCIGANKGYTYDENGLLVSKTDWSGAVTEYAYDDLGLETLRIEAVGTEAERKTKTIWHSQFRLPTKIIESGKTTLLSYDSKGLLIEKTIKDTSSKRDFFEKLAGRYDQRTWSYEYNDSGLLAKVDGPREDVADITTFEYDQYGSQTAAINSLGYRSEVLSHNENGLPLKTKDVNGIETQFAYNARGWLVSTTRILGENPETTQYIYKKDSDYLGKGLIESVRLPNGRSLHYEYDIARRVVAKSNDLGERIEFELDSQGNRIKETVYDGTGNIARAQKRVYDELSRLLESVGASGGTYRYNYDGAGRVLSETNGLGNAKTFAYDALSRLVAKEDATGKVLTNYDAHNRVTSVTDQRGLTTEYKYNGFGEKVVQISPDTGKTRFEYDNAGNVIKKIDSRQDVMVQKYDALNRVVETSFPSKPEENISYVYDRYENFNVANDDQLVGRIAEVHDASGHSYFEYNIRGQVLSQHYKIDDAQYTLSYKYDRYGDIASVVYPSGREVSYRTDKLSGQLTSIETMLNGELSTLVRDAKHEAFGTLAGFTYGNGSELEIARDQKARITDIRVTGGPTNDAIYDVGVVYDLASNIEQIKDQVRNEKSKEFNYDAANRLVNAQGKFGLIEYEYDGVGNRLSRNISSNARQSQTAKIQETYKYAQDSNRLLSVERMGDDGSRDNRALNYDSVGNIVVDAKPQNQKEMVYGARNRLQEVVINELGETVHYQYNAKGQRVSKTTAEQVVHFHFDVVNRLIGETTIVNGVVTEEAEYVYIHGQRVAILETKDEQATDTLFVVNDHLGTPQLLMDNSEAVVWEMDASPFGELASIDADQGQSFRFPGQYSDDSTGYSYNYFRDYDPSLGRYIQSDPIGLRGGVNTFAYVLGNPVSLYDYYGESPACLAGPWAVAACAVIGGVSAYKAYDAGRNVHRAYKGAQGVQTVIDNSDKFVPPEGSSSLSINPESGNPYAVDEIQRTREDYFEVMGQMNEVIQAGGDLADPTPDFADGLKKTGEIILERCK